MCGPLFGITHNFTNIQNNIFVNRLSEENVRSVLKKTLSLFPPPLSHSHPPEYDELKIPSGLLILHLFFRNINNVSNISIGNLYLSSEKKKHP